jgi:PST family polysaccharide transporter
MIFKNLWHPVLSTLVMSVVALLLKQINDGMLWDFLSIAICIVVYFSVLFTFRNERERYFIPILKKVKNKIKL